MKPLNVRYTTETKVHFPGTYTETACSINEFLYPPIISDRFEEVTCKRCQKHIGQLTNIRKVGKS